MAAPNAPRQPDHDARTARARRMALWLGAVAVIVFVGFIIYVGNAR